MGVIFIYLLRLPERPLQAWLGCHQPLQQLKKRRIIILADVFDVPQPGSPDRFPICPMAQPRPGGRVDLPAPAQESDAVPLDGPAQTGCARRVADFYEEERHRADGFAYRLFQGILLFAYLPGCTGILAPVGSSLHWPTVAVDQRGPHMQAKDRPAVIAASGHRTVEKPPMVPQAVPQRGPGTLTDRMGTHSHHAHSLARARATLTGLKEEVHPSVRQQLTETGFGQQPFPADLLFQQVELGVEDLQVS